MNEPTILRWAAGAQTPIGSTVDLDGETLLQAALRHKLTGRLLHRIERDAPPWITAEIVDGLRDQQMSIQRGFERRLEQVSDIAAALTSYPDPLGVLKGITTFVLTGHDRGIRHSNDIDLLWTDPDALKQTLLGLGYRDSDDFCRDHEYASLYFENLNADIHRYFPVPSIADGLVAVDLDPAAHAGRWEGLTAMNEHRVGYTDLREDSVIAAIAGFNVVVADASLAVFLLCVHSFREYCHTPVLLPYATMRLGELCEIRDLMALPSFKPRRLRSLVERFNGGEAMRYAAFLMRSQLGTPILTMYENGHPTFPYDLWLPGFTIADDRAAEPDSLVVRPEGEVMSRFISWLGGTTVIAGDALSCGQRLSTASTSATTLVGRALIHGAPPDITVVCRWGARSLIIEVEVIDAPAGTEVVLVNFGDILYEVAYRTSSDDLVTRRRRHTARPKSASGNTKWKANVPSRVVHGSGRHVIEITLEWKALLAMSSSLDTVSFLLGVRRETDAMNGLLLPIHLRRR